MSTNTLLERMRKLREERERAAAAAAASTSTATSSTQPPTVPSTQSGPSSAPLSQPTVVECSSTRGGRGASETQSSLHSSQTNASATTLATPRGQDFLLNTPPSFISPASTVPRYRDGSRDALCASFTSESAVQLYLSCVHGLRADQATQSSNDNHSSGNHASSNARIHARHPSREGDETHDDKVNSSKEEGREDGPGQAVERAGLEMQDKQTALIVSHFSNAMISSSKPYTFVTDNHQGAALVHASSLPHSNLPVDSTLLQRPANTPREEKVCASLYDDVAYRHACERACVDTGTDVRPPCRDVNLYTRRDRIAHGVYGVVFSATRTLPDVAEDASTACRSSEACGATTADAPNASDGSLPHDTHTNCHAAASSAASSHVMWYALKHIKKQWLSESQVGFPPYLLREFDLLLRLHHPNIVEAKELVLLDPLPSSTSAEESEEGRGGGEGDAGHPVAGDERGQKQMGDRCTSSAEEGRRHVQQKDGQQASLRSREGVEAAPHKQQSSSSSSSRSSSLLNSNSVTAKALAAVGTTSKVKDVFLVMEYCCHDLKSYMLRCSRDTLAPYFHLTRRNTHPHAARDFLSRVKSILYQLLSGLSFLHNHRIIHRDIKTSNILLNHRGYVKLADFGLGRLYREGQPLTPTVVTLMYRAPELHLGVTDYSHTMDVWSVGCVFAELFLKQPLFRAATDAAHLLAVCDVLGIPTEESFPGLYHLPAAREVMRGLHRWNRHDRLQEIFDHACRSGSDAASPMMPESGMALLRAMLRWNPSDRIGAAEALRHAFFHEHPLPCAPEHLMRPMPFATCVNDSGTTMSAATPPPRPVQHIIMTDGAQTDEGVVQPSATTATTETTLDAAKPRAAAASSSSSSSSHELLHSMQTVTPVPVCAVDVALRHDHVELTATQAHSASEEARSYRNTHGGILRVRNESVVCDNSSNNINSSEDNNNGIRRRLQRPCATLADASMSPTAEEEGGGARGWAGDMAVEHDAPRCREWRAAMTRRRATVWGCVRQTVHQG